MTSEKQIFEERSSIFPWRPSAWLRVTGSDAADFLQGQLTNDLRGLAAGGAVYGLLLNHKGRVLADAFVVRGEAANEFWLGSYFVAAAVIRERLEAFVIADDVSVTDETDGWQALSVWGGPAAPDGVFSFPGRRSAEPNCEWVFRVEAADGVRARLAGATELSAAEMERRRIAAGIPAVPTDLGPGELPNEGGLETAAISYAKGCYLGQEVMARLKSMGQVRRRLLRVRGGGERPPVAAALFQGERRVGELRSAVAVDGGFEGLALLSLVTLDRRVPLSLAANGEARVQLTEAS